MTIRISRPMLEDIKRVPRLRALLEAGEITVKAAMPTAAELAFGTAVRKVNDDGSIERVELEDFFK